MRVLVVGTTPPPGGASARAFGRLVAARTEAGDRCEICSPDSRSAAHRHADLRGLRLPLRLAIWSRRFDALILRIEPELPFEERASRLQRAATLVALGFVASLFSEVTCVLDSPIPLPGGVGGRASARWWRRVDRIEVSADEDRRQVVAAPGVSPERVFLAEIAGEQVSVHKPQGWPAPTDPDLRSEVLVRIHDRAQRRREVNGARIGLGSPSAGPVPMSPFAGPRARPERSGLALAAVGAAAARARRALRALGR